MKSTDIPQLIRGANYCVDISLGDVPWTLKKFVDRYNLELDPDFQRQHVWTEKQQIAFVEYLLSGGRDPRAIIIQFNCPDWQRNPQSDYHAFVLVDGKQRIRAIQRFLDCEIGVFHGHLLSKFEDRDILLRRFGVKFAINELQTREQVLTWYLQMNAGGTIHTRAEIDKVRTLLKAEHRRDVQ